MIFIKKIFYVNCIESGYDLLNFLLENKVKIGYIISLNSEQAEKYNVSGYKDFSVLSKKHQIPIYYPERYDLRDDKDREFFRKQKPDLLLCFGWQRLIPKEILAQLSIGALGYHGSSEPLPKGRGRSPINWSLIENKKRFILHLFYLDEGADSGDIIDWIEFDLNEFDTCKTVYHKVQVGLKRLILKNLQPILEGKAKRIEQDDSKATYYPKRNPEDGKIDWNNTTLQIYNLIRAVTKPYPGAFSFIAGKKIMIWKCQPFDTKIKYDKKKNGEIVEIFLDNTFVVKTRDTSILVTKYDIGERQLIKIGNIIK